MHEGLVFAKCFFLQIYKTELEEASAFDGFNDVVHSFTLLRGKSNGNDDDDESRIYGKFKVSGYIDVFFSY